MNASFMLLRTVRTHHKTNNRCDGQQYAPFHSLGFVLIMKALELACDHCTSSVRLACLYLVLIVNYYIENERVREDSRKLQAHIHIVRITYDCLANGTRKFTQCSPSAQPLLLRRLLKIGRIHLE